jgi:uncharacterized membrane protein YsdA (DUF1294 family)
MISVAPPTSSRFSKTLLWVLMGVAVLAVLLFTELPILRDAALFHDYRNHLVRDRYLLIPHIFFGALALLSGPAQFSSRLRRRHLCFHRVLGRVYVASVLLAAVLALLLSAGGDLFIGECVHAGAWMICTLAAFLTARNRQIVQHCQWMIRSYAVTFTFILLRLPNSWPAYVNLSDASFTVVNITTTFLAVLGPDLAFNWRELTIRRV